MSDITETDTSFWVTIAKKVRVRCTKDGEAVSCDCEDPRHLYYNKYPDFKCESMRISEEKIERYLNGQDTKKNM